MGFNSETFKFYSSLELDLDSLMIFLKLLNPKLGDLVRLTNEIKAVS